VPLCESFDTVGPLCRTVEDCALLLAAMEGGRAADLRDTSLRGTRLAVLETTAFDDIEDAPAQAFENAVARLAAAGATVERLRHDPMDEAMALSPILFAPEAYGTWKEAIEAAPERMFPQILERFRGGAAVAAADFVAGWRRLRALRAGYLAASAGYDAVLVPTCPILPPNAARLETDGDYFKRANLLTLRNTRIGNLMGLCVLTLPTGVPATGLSLMAAPGTEEALLRLGAAAEAALA
jgi:aspartyl-tRNA(Asn)/glutamyl-tRNA(Gln) amidotransferase subunit A